MSTQAYLFKYQLSSRTLFSWPRMFQVREFGLDDTGDTVASCLSKDSHGLLLRSVPLPQVQESIQSLRREDGLLPYVMQQFPRHYIDMRNTDFETYKSKFSSKTRSTINRKVRKFAEMTGGSLRWLCYSTPAELDTFWQLARTVTEKRYQERLLDAGLPDSQSYKEQSIQWAERDSLRAFLLFDGDRPTAYLFCPVRDGIVEYAFLGYDPDYQHLSAGTVLQWLALEQLFAEKRFRYFDFTAGDSEHKRLFGTGRVDCANIALLRPTVAHRLLIASHRAFTSGAEALGRWLDTHGLKTRLRRWLRSSGGP